MKEFINTYKSDVIYVLTVIVIVVAIYILTRVLHKWLIKKIKEKLPNASVKPIHVIKRIINVLLLILGVIALTFVFVGTDTTVELKAYFKLFSYLGVIALITVVAVTICNIWFRHLISEKIEQNDDPTSYKFLRYVVLTIISFVGILLGLLAFPALKGVAQTALGGAGVIALIAGVASQEALANLVGGLFIISFKPFKIGDIVKISESMVGTVTDITLRHTVIRNFDNKMIVIPNAIINKEKIINYDLGEHKCCERLEIGISYDSDIDLARKIMQEECENHPLILDNRSPQDKNEGKPVVRTALTALEDFSVTIRAWAWGSNFSDTFALKCDVLESVKKRFDREGIEIPFPYRTIVMKNENNQAEK